MQLFDLHCDTLYRALTEGDSICVNKFFLSVKRGKKYNPWIQCFAVWIPDDFRGKKAIDLFEKSYLKLNDDISNNSSMIMQCKSSEDLKRAIKENKCAAIFTVEGGAALGGKISTLEEMAHYGVKIMTLTWNGECELGDGCGVSNARGLTEFGKRVVGRMEELNIIVDLSHASDKLFYDVCEITNKPIIATHSNSRTICNHVRNLTDAQFEIIRNRKGLVGINFYPEFLSTNHRATFDDILRHVEHFLSLKGEDVICLGSDFDGADMPKEIEGVESLSNLYEYFLKHNYSQTITDDIFFNNAYNFFKNNIV